MTTPLPPVPPRPDELEKAVASLTTYRGGETELWKAALDDAGGAVPRRAWMGRLVRRPTSSLVATCVVLVGVVGLAVLLMPRQRGTTSGVHYQMAAPIATEVERLGGQRVSPASRDSEVGEMQKLGKRRGGSGHSEISNLGSQFLDLKAEGMAAAAVPSERFVVRKANMDLQTADVRAAFAKAAHLVSEARGEFVENTSLTGDGPATRANLTLRVAADRLGEVLDDLRELGTVRSESTSGEDVTNQVVDLEARIRNETRVETELLELLAQRKDAPLKDIMELRGSLASVRQSIEQMVAQRDRLGRLVSLSSILVVIRTADEATKPAPAASIADYFSSRISVTWTGGLRFLADTLANIVGLLIGGLLWWLLAGVCLLGIHRYRRRLAARCV